MTFTKVCIDITIGQRRRDVIKIRARGGTKTRRRPSGCRRRRRRRHHRSVRRQTERSLPDNRHFKCASCRLNTLHTRLSGKRNFSLLLFCTIFFFIPFRRFFFLITTRSARRFLNGFSRCHERLPKTSSVRAPNLSVFFKVILQTVVSLRASTVRDEPVSAIANGDPKNGSLEKILSIALVFLWFSVCPNFCGLEMYFSINTRFAAPMTLVDLHIESSTGSLTPFRPAELRLSFNPRYRPLINVLLVETYRCLLLFNTVRFYRLPLDGSIFFSQFALCANRF